MFKLFLSNNENVILFIPFVQSEHADTNFKKFFAAFELEKVR